MIPSKTDQVKDVDDDDSSPTDIKSDKVWEMQGLRSPMTPAIPRTPGVNTNFTTTNFTTTNFTATTFTATPFTPRTQAFHTLNRKLPLRQE